MTKTDSPITSLTSSNFSWTRHGKTTISLNHSRPPRQTRLCSWVRRRKISGVKGCLAHTTTTHAHQLWGQNCKSCIAQSAHGWLGFMGRKSRGGRGAYVEKPLVHAYMYKSYGLIVNHRPICTPCSPFTSWLTRL